MANFTGKREKLANSQFTTSSLMDAYNRNWLLGTLIKDDDQYYYSQKGIFLNTYLYCLNNFTYCIFKHHFPYKAMIYLVENYNNIEWKVILFEFAFFKNYLPIVCKLNLSPMLCFWLKNKVSFDAFSQLLSHVSKRWN